MASCVSELSDVRDAHKRITLCCLHAIQILYADKFHLDDFMRDLYGRWGG
jgi:hypothetical protein